MLHSRNELPYLHIVFLDDSKVRRETFLKAVGVLQSNTEKSRHRKYRLAYTVGTTSFHVNAHILSHKPEIIFLDHDLEDETDWDSGMRVVEFLCAAKQLQAHHTYSPIIVLHTENEPKQILMEKALREAGYGRILLHPFFSISKEETFKILLCTLVQEVLDDKRLHHN